MKIKDEFIDKEIELKKNEQLEKLKLLSSYNALDTVHKHEKLLHETNAPLDRLMALKYGYCSISEGDNANLEAQYVDPDNNNLQLALYFNKKNIATIPVDENYHGKFLINGSDITIDMNAAKREITSEINDNKGFIVKSVGSNFNYGILMDYDVPPSMHTALCALGADNLIISEYN